MSSNGAAASRDAEHWRAEAARLHAEMAACADRIRASITPGGGGGSTHPKAAASTRGADSDREGAASEALLEGVDALLARVAELKASLGEMEAMLAASQAAFDALRGQLDSVDGVGHAKVLQAQQAAKAERAVLVTSALESLRHLRQHLVKALSGLREVATPAMPAGAMPPQGTQMVWGQQRGG